MTLELSPQELDSALWKKLASHFTDKLALARRQNDNDLEEIRTYKMRGKIAAYKELLGLDPAMSTTDREASGVEKTGDVK